MASPLASLELWLALAAGRLLLRAPEDGGLRHLAERALPVQPPEALARAIPEEANHLFDQLEAEAFSTPLGRIAVGCQLSAFDLELLALAALPCLEEGAACAVAAMGGGERRLRVGIALQLVGGNGLESGTVRQALRTSPLWKRGLLRPLGQDGPWLERRLDPTATLLAVLDGAIPERIGEGWTGVLIEPPQRISNSLREQGQRLRELEAQGPVQLIGPPGRAERVLAVSADGAPCVVFEATSGDPGPPPWEEAALLQLVTGTRVALRTGALQLQAPAANLPVVPLIAPDTFSFQGQHATLWRLELGGNDPLELSAAWLEALTLAESEADLLASRTWLDQDQVGRIAAGLAPQATAAKVLQRVAALSQPRPSGMASRRVPRVAWSQLKVPPGTERGLEAMVRRVERRVTVQERWGMAMANRRRGVVGLLHGDSGTGKTLAAEALATRLTLPMLVVDLASVVSKYIGETEKNLAEVFAAAEGFASLLFFDEADALFGRRTQVQDAHDRYANIEVNYLLQRLELFEGLVVLSSNRLKGMDEAFLRRFDEIVAFPRPAAAQRLDIWRLHLPDHHVSETVDLGQLARRFELTGGEIRNVALAAAYAAAEREGVITLEDLEKAAGEELSKTGRPFPGRPP